MDDAIVKRIREFNRYYTVWLEVMNKEYLGTGLSWAESRVLFEIHRCPGINAAELCRLLNIDKSYMSRILRQFEKRGLLTRELVLGSKGVKKIGLTEAGENTARQIDNNGTRQMAEKLKGLDADTCLKLCEAMEFIKRVLSEKSQGGMQE